MFKIETWDIKASGNFPLIYVTASHIFLILNSWPLPYKTFFLLAIEGAKCFLFSTPMLYNTNWLNAYLFFKV